MVAEVNGIVVLELDADGPLLRTDRDASDLLSEAFSTEATVIAVPLARFDPAFLQLSSGIAGTFFQKMQNYQRRLVIVGDISAALAGSQALEAFVRETNRVGNHLFVPDRAAMVAKLGG